MKIKFNISIVILMFMFVSGCKSSLDKVNPTKAFQEKYSLSTRAVITYFKPCSATNEETVTVELNGINETQKFISLLQFEAYDPNEEPMVVYSPSDINVAMYKNNTLIDVFSFLGTGLRGVDGREGMVFLTKESEKYFLIFLEKHKIDYPPERL